MHAAVVSSFERAPTYGEFLIEPEAQQGEALVTVRAAALSNLVRAQASGKHYSSSVRLPMVPGNDGVGVLEDGTRVYFLGPRAPFGSMAERTVVARSQTIPLPDDVDDVTAAALGNPGLASWGSLLSRAKLQPGETVLINGATGAAGQQAVQAAKFLGANRVVVTGRNPAGLAKLTELGADDTIALEQPESELCASFARELREGGVDVVLDFLWGHSAELLLRAAAGSGAPEGERRVRYVQIGSISGATVEMNAGWLRSSGLELMGSGLGSLSAQQILSALARMYGSVKEARLRVETDAVPLKDVESSWARPEEGRRIVFTVP